MVSDRGQVHTLEAIVAGLLLLSSVVFALQMTAVTPLSASTSSQHIENQLEATAEGVLATAARNGSLRQTVLYWNSTESKFYGATASGFYTRRLPTSLGRRLQRTFGDRGIAYNVYVTYYKAGRPQRKPILYRGEPTDNAVSAGKTVVIANDTRLLNEDMTRGPRVNSSNFYADDNGAGPLFDVVRVEVVVWRI
ncbi:MAG: hypothetical protein ABEJ94_12910 [Halorientalis sp.]